MVKVAAGILSVFAIIGAVLFCGTARADELSPRQRELWNEAHKRLTAVYLKQGRVAAPMGKEEAEGIRVPLLCDKSKSGPLPWDVKLLLQFDRNMVLETHYSQPHFFSFLQYPAREPFVPDDLMDFFINEVLSDHEPIKEGDSERAVKKFLEGGAKLPAVLSLSQIGGDELPGVIMLDDPQACTPVVHFDYDDEPEIYLRNVCLLEYVAYYIDYDSLPGSMGERTDRSSHFSAKEQEAVMALLEPVIKAYNEAFMAGLAEVLPEYGY